MTTEASVDDAASSRDSGSAHVTRAIAADPTSTALLLAGPTAMDLWPGLRRVGEADGRALVEAELSYADTVGQGTVRALPPRRTPTAYVTRFEVDGPGLPDAVCTLTLSYAPDADGVVGTHAELDIEAAGLLRSGLSPASLHELAGGFLDNLAEAAESRSDAA